MTQPKQPIPHKYAEVLKWIAEGKPLQVNLSSGWGDCTAGYAIGCISKDYSSLLMPKPDDFRLKPETITINGVECPVNCGGNPDFYVSIRTNSNEHVFRYESRAHAESVFDALYKPFLERS